MKTELKNCLSLYKIFYSCAFILILCVIHPIIYYEEIGSAIQSPIAFLTIIFCYAAFIPARLCRTRFSAEKWIKQKPMFKKSIFDKYLILLLKYDILAIGKG